MASGKVSYTSTYYDHLKMYFQGNHGCSGAPVWRPGTFSRVSAIHSNGSDDDFGGAVGAGAIRATRIDWRVGTDLMGYINQCQGGWSWPDGCDLHVD